METMCAFDNVCLLTRELHELQRSPGKFWLIVERCIAHYAFKEATLALAARAHAPSLSDECLQHTILAVILHGVTHKNSKMQNTERNFEGICKVRQLSRVSTLLCNLQSQGLRRPTKCQKRPSTGANCSQIC